ncbi:hypothetical protein INT43_002883 [Umbelopsis isabellina]|uniref:Uncharacterized protein n=1 Tax=Mortierella isabellina TaxID=91625 RepID=A0A8H7Q6H2_MORIS|nr:hypothetical protein INT43_002883 [Umbelopsis isabellina]
MVHAAKPETAWKIALVPSISIQLTWMDALVLLASSVGMWGIARADRIMMRVQLIIATAVLQNRDHYILHNLRQSWIRAYESNKNVILDIQREFRCQGFAHPEDIMVQMPEFYGALTGCQLPLVQTFGSKMYSIGVMTMIIRLIQFVGIFLLSFVLHQIRIADNEADMPEDEEITEEEGKMLLINEALYLDDSDSGSVDLISFNDDEKFALKETIQTAV